MTALPVTRVWTAGEVVTATEMNDNLSAVLNFLMQSPLVRCRSTIVQSLANNTLTPINFDTEDVDNAGMHSTSVNTSRMTAVYPGWYRVTGQVCTGVSSTGRRGGQWQVNGSARSASTAYVAAPTGVPEVPMRTTSLFLNVGDYVELCAFQDSGGSLNTVISGTQDQIGVEVKWESS